MSKSEFERAVIVEANASLGLKLRALFYLLLVTFLSRFMSFESLRNHFLCPLAPTPGRRLDELIDAIDSASWRFLRQITCLPKALVLTFLGRKEGIDLVLRLGVRRLDEASGELEAHAWVEQQPSGVIVFGEVSDSERSYSQLV